jgi:hypothetical protein
VKNFGRFGFAIVTALTFGLELSGGSALAWDWAPTPAHAFRSATTSGFTVNANVTVGVDAKVLAVHATPTLPTVLPYNPSIPIVNIQPVVTAGTRPLVVGSSAPAVVTIYGVDNAGNTYDISSAAWMSTPQVVTWSGGTVIPNKPTDPNTILLLGYSTQPNSPGKMLGMSFTETAPTVQANPAYNIQVSAIVVMNNALPNGSMQSWSFNDLVSTVASGTTIPPPAPTYDILLEIPGNPPYTTKILNVPAASLTIAP